MTDSSHNNEGEESLPPNNGSGVSTNDGPANNNIDGQQIQLQRSIVSSSENSVTSNSTVSAKTTAVGLAAAAVNDGAAAASAADVKPETSEEGEKADNAVNEDATSTKNTNAVLLQMNAPPHYPVAEFLFQLTKMLTDDNQEFIEWKKSSIVVHDPPGLEKQILPKYFRHSNYSSFQRQMNYFGFRKIAGKGKMAACSYVNENATEDISSLLYIKRKKTGVAGNAAKILAQANKMNRRAQQAATLGMDAQMGAMNNMMMLNGVNPLMLGGNVVGMMGINPQQQLLLLQQQQQNANLMGLNGLQGINGLQLQGMNGLQGLGGMGGGINGLNMLVSKPGQAVGALSNNLNSNESTRMSQQQQILAQLQQAHASASSGLNASTAGNNTLPNQALKNTFGINGIQGTAPILTNDQGNVYNAGSGQSNTAYATSVTGVNPQAQVLLMQQAAAMGGLGSFTQGALGVAPSTTANSNEKGFDAGANFRLLLNQQINQFSTGNQAPAPLSGAPSDGNQGANAMINMIPQQMASNLPQGLSYEQFFQLNGMANGAAAPATINGNAQQLQRNNAT